MGEGPLPLAPASPPAGVAFVCCTQVPPRPSATPKFTHQALVPATPLGATHGAPRTGTEGVRVPLSLHPSTVRAALPQHHHA